MNLEQTVEKTLKEGGFAGDWIDVEDLDLVRYIVGRLNKFSTLSKDEIESRFINHAHIYSASKMEYEKSSLLKVETSLKLKKAIEENRAIALTSSSLFVRELAKVW